MGWLFCGDYFRCCSYFRPINASNGTRFLYCAILLLCTSLSACFLSREVSDKIRESYFDFESNCANFSDMIFDSSSLEMFCSDLLAVSGAYRIFISLSIFHAVMFFLTLGVHDNRTARARLHNGFWAWKLLFIAALIFASFFVETTPDIEMILMIIGMVGASVFLIVQLFCLSDFAANWALSWEAAAKTKGSHWTVFIWIVSVLLSLCFCCSCYLMYRVFLHTPDGRACTENMVVLVSNGSLSLVLLLTSFLCLSQNSSSSILQCSILSIYISFLTASALASYPPMEEPFSTSLNATENQIRCRDFKFLESFVNGPNIKLPEIQDEIGEESPLNSALVYNMKETLSVVSLDSLLRVFALVFAILSGCYTSFRNVSGFSELDDIPLAPMFCCHTGNSVQQGYDITVAYIDDEAQQLQYNYNLLHLMYITASLFMMMTLTNWYQPEKVKGSLVELSFNETAATNHVPDRLFGGVEEIADGSIAIFWVKSATAFACQFLFLVIVIGRLHHRNRNRPASCKWFLTGNDLVHRQTADDNSDNSLQS